MKEIVVISGKGGTGKTSITASLAMLLPQKVIADCDVDAADLHLLLQPDIQERHDFYAGIRPVIDEAACTGCGTCMSVCRFSAVTVENVAVIDEFNCEGCGVCAYFCPSNAISLQENLCGEWYISQTQYGPMVHAALGIGEENSGKLVTLVKEKARRLAEAQGAELILVDGPPGIGCPVIASISNANKVLIVTEPTLSGLHDLERVLGLAQHFKTPSLVCINKWDINAEVSHEIEARCAQKGVQVVGKIPFDEAMPKGLVAGLPVVEYDAQSPAARAIYALCDAIDMCS
ncbi:MAG: ATP-binding protein [Deltaproteobacteria bacterium]|nr:ATP-binding protein [Deltaproteobacteria bacterium]